MDLFRRKLTFAKRALRVLGKYALGYMNPGRYRARNVPAVSVETTNVCNSKCVFCANPHMKRRKQQLDMATFKALVDELAAMGGTELCFNTTIGDPLLDPQILERARYVIQYPQFGSLGFVTTLQWLHRFEIDEVFQSGITWLSVSITLSGAAKYREFFGVDKYEAALNNLHTLISENKKRGNPMYIYIGLKPTHEPLESILNHPDFRFVDSQVEQDLVGDARSQTYYCDDWIGSVKLPQYLKKRPLYPRAFRPCMLLFKGLMVYSNGTVGACSCRDFEANSELILGDVRNQSLSEMWTGNKLSDLRRRWLTRNEVPDICKSCRHYLY